jgi:hypothetical protein
LPAKKAVNILKLVSSEYELGRVPEKRFWSNSSSCMLWQPANIGKGPAKQQVPLGLTKAKTVTVWPILMIERKLYSNPMAKGHCKFHCRRGSIPVKLLDIIERVLSLVLLLKSGNGPAPGQKSA